MKNLFRTILMIAFAAMPVVAAAQKSSDPAETVTYSLPSTTLVIDVEAVQENFYAGPYARYAEKYLGIKARQKDETNWQIAAIGLTPVVEADLGRRYSLTVAAENADLSFLKLTSAGLISFADGGYGIPQNWRFPMAEGADFSGKGVSSNLKSEATTLYRNERRESEFNRVSVQQNMVVEKTIEQKAAEAAQMIVRLREQKLQIVTGDTDATYSGEAMGAAIEELTRLENEYMSLFIGYSDYQTQKASFDLIPSAERESQMYVAFRISDTSGPVPADNLSGRPVVMEIVAPAAAPVEPADPKLAKKAAALQQVHYLVPAVCTVKIKDGSELVMQSRVPVYQLGVLSSVPVTATIQ